MRVETVRQLAEVEGSRQVREKKRIVGGYDGKGGGGRKDSDGSSRKTGRGCVILGGC